MKKSLLILSLTLTLTLAVPMVMSAIPVAPGIEEFIEEEITITINGQTVIVTGAQGQTLEVVSLTGRCVKSEI